MTKTIDQQKKDLLSAFKKSKTSVTMRDQFVYNVTCGRTVHIHDLNSFEINKIDKILKESFIRQQIMYYSSSVIFLSGKVTAIKIMSEKKPVMLELKEAYSNLKKLKQENPVIANDYETDFIISDMLDEVGYVIDLLEKEA
ncbi:hypothetical protein [Pedobacter antarcticus]|uniref:hypothetical protein n=1 Tax=Pedobacter antarcticus TaxID=34086 RepID=UPI00292DBA11|nr:hypothetical protein [Pedobacter antarcticus]